MQPFPSVERLHDETTVAGKTVVARRLTASGQERSAYVSDLLRRDVQHVPDPANLCHERQRSIERGV